MIKTQEDKLLLERIRRYRATSKSSLPDDVAQHIVQHITGISNIKPNLCDDNPLSIMEMLCLILLTMGYVPKTCAKFLDVKLGTIKTYEERLRYKLSAKNRTHAFYLTLIKGYLVFAK